jgi:hypothetical protein
MWLQLLESISLALFKIYHTVMELPQVSCYSQVSRTQPDPGYPSKDSSTVSSLLKHKQDGFGMNDEQVWDTVAHTCDSGLRCLEVPDPSDSSPGLGLAFRAIATTIQGKKHIALLVLGLGRVSMMLSCATRKVALGDETKTLRVDSEELKSMRRCD